MVGYYRALPYLSLNNKDETLPPARQQSFKERDGADISWIKVDPLLDPLRGDPRFDALRSSASDRAKSGRSIHDAEALARHVGSRAKADAKIAVMPAPKSK